MERALDPFTILRGGICIPNAYRQQLSVREYRLEGNLMSEAQYPMKLNVDLSLQVGELALAHLVPIGPIKAPELQQALRQLEALPCRQEEWPAQQEQA
jgi:hypothetical protein